MNIYKFAKRILRLYYWIVRPTTVGVRVIAVNQSGEVLLVQHKDDGLHYIPGGGVKKGETLVHAISREVKEECHVKLYNITVAAAYTNFYENKNDHIILFTATCDEKPQCGSEVCEAGFYPINKLPINLSVGTSKRINEYKSKQLTSGKW